jgi:hypothetical protein
MTAAAHTVDRDLLLLRLKLGRLWAREGRVTYRNHLHDVADVRSPDGTHHVIHTGYEWTCTCTSDCRCSHIWAVIEGPNLAGVPVVIERRYTA